MKKLILAISGVFCLQLGFIAYNASDSASENSFIVIDEGPSDTFLASSVVVPFFDQKPHDIQFESVTADLDEYVAPDVSAKRHDPSATLSTRTPTWQPRKRREMNTFVASEKFETLKPVKVTYRTHDGVEFKQFDPRRERTEYPAAQASDREAKTFQIAGKQSSGKKKKNMFVRVITKPYDWLKAIGSTFK